MSLLDRLKSVLGLGQSSNGQADDPVAVTVEREPDVDIVDSDPDPENEAETPSDDEPAAEKVDPVPVTEISGIGPAYGERLESAGVSTVADLASADASSLAASTEIAEGRVSGWIEAANKME